MCVPRMRILSSSGLSRSCIAMCVYSSVFLASIHSMILSTPSYLQSIHSVEVNPIISFSLSFQYMHAQYFRCAKRISLASRSCTATTFSRKGRARRYLDVTRQLQGQPSRLRAIRFAFRDAASTYVFSPQMEPLCMPQKQ